jgi:hypothetical protein
MPRRTFRNIGLTFLKGFLLGACLFLIFFEFDWVFPAISNVILFPAAALASLWHKAGLPLEGEAGIVFPLLIFEFFQCCAMGWVAVWLLEPKRTSSTEHK